MGTPIAPEIKSGVRYHRDGRREVHLRSRRASAGARVSKGSILRL